MNILSYAVTASLMAGFSSLAAVADDPVQVLHAWGSTSNGINEVPSELFAAMEESRIIQMTDSGNSSHIGAVLDDGRIFLWGSNNAGQCDPPGDVGTIFDPVVSLATGRNHTIALMGDGRVVCWGSNDGLECDVPIEALESMSSVEAVVAGQDFSACYLEDGDVVVWGTAADLFPNGKGKPSFLAVWNVIEEFEDPSDGSSPPEWGLNAVTKIAAGDLAIFVGFDTGHVWCWGGWIYVPTFIDERDGPDESGSIGSIVDLTGGTFQGGHLTTDGICRRWGYAGQSQQDPPDSLIYTEMAGCQGYQTGFTILARDSGKLYYTGGSSDLDEYDEDGVIQFVTSGIPGDSEIVLGCAVGRGFAAGVPYVQNTTAGRFATNLTDALAEAEDGDEIYAIPSLFTGSALDFYDRPVFVESRGVVDLPTTETWTLGGSARLGAYEDIRIGGGLQVAANAAISLRPDRGGEVQHAIVVENGGRFSLNNNSATEVIATTGVRVDGQLNLSTDSVLFNDIGGGIEVGPGGELMAIDANLRVASLDVLADSAGRGSAFCLGSTFDVDQTSIAGGILNVLGGTVIGDVAVDAGSEADGTLNASGTIFGDLYVIDGRATSLDDLVIVGDLFNRVDGVVAVQVGTLFVTGGIANEGQIYGEVVGAPGFMGGGSTSQGDGLAIAGDLTLGPDASIRFSEPLWQISLGGDFDVAITSPSQFELIGSTLRLDGSSGETQHFEATSLDIGPDPLAFTDPPAGVSLIRELEIVSQTGVTVVDQHLNGGGKSNAREAIYASRLEVAEGASLVLGEHILYCTEADIDGAVDHPDQIVVVSILPDPDFNDDGLVNGADLAFILAFWGTNDPDVDLNGDGMVTAADLGILLGAWGVYP